MTLTHCCCKKRVKDADLLLQFFATVITNNISIAVFVHLFCVYLHLENSGAGEKLNFSLFSFST